MAVSYIDGKQTISQLALRYGVDKSTIWRRLKTMRHVRVISQYRDVVVNMATTYWGRSLSSKKVNVLELPSHLSHRHSLLRGYDAPIRLLALMLSAVFSINI